MNLPKVEKEGEIRQVPSILPKGRSWYLNLEFWTHSLDMRDLRGDRVSFAVSVVFLAFDF